MTSSAYLYIHHQSGRCTLPTIQQDTIQYSTARYSTVQYSKIQYSTVQQDTVQYSKIQYSTVHGPVQYSTYTSKLSTVQYTDHRPPSLTAATQYTPS